MSHILNHAAALAEAGAIVQQSQDSATLDRALWLARSATTGGISWWTWLHRRISGETTDEHTAFLFGDILDADQFLEQLNECRGRIILQINCRGGNTRAALEIARWLADRGNVLGVVTGECSSAANLILAGCSRRVCRPTSKFMVHAVKASVLGNPSQLRAGAGDLDAFLCEVIAFMAQRTEQSAATIRDWFSGPDLHFNAQEAMAAGLVDAIVPPIAGDPKQPAPADPFASTAESETHLACELLTAVSRLQLADKQAMRSFCPEWLTVAPANPAGCELGTVAPGNLP